MKSLGGAAVLAIQCLYINLPPSLFVLMGIAIGWENWSPDFFLSCPFWRNWPPFTRVKCWLVSIDCCGIFGPCVHPFTFPPLSCSHLHFTLECCEFVGQLPTGCRWQIFLFFFSFKWILCFIFCKYTFFFCLFHSVMLILSKHMLRSSLVAVDISGNLVICPSGANIN